ncbi:MAG: hypothetical protein ACR2MQ_07185 [Gemmatimonadaceae bacterium]
MLRKAATLIVIVLAITAGAVTAAAAQDSTAAYTAPSPRTTPDSAPPVAGLRNPFTAALLGTLIPGAGLAYAGQWVRGVGTYFGTIGTVALGSGLVFIDRCTFAFSDSGNCNPGSVWPQRTLGVGVIATGLGLWAYSAVDATRIVERNNARKIAGQRAMFGSIQPIVAVPATQGYPWTVGVHVTW